MELQPGLRVMVPFGRSNRHTEGVVLSVEEGSEAGLKNVASVLDEVPVLSHTMLQLAAFMRNRYFATFFDWFADDLRGADHRTIIDRYLRGYYNARNEGENSVSCKFAERTMIASSPCKSVPTS